MNDRRSLLVAVSCPSAVMAGWLALSLSAYAPALIENSGANAAAVSRAKDLTRLELADVPRAATIEDGIALTADIAASVAASPPIAEAAAPEAPAPAIKLASADPALILPAEVPPAAQISPEPEPVVSEAPPEPEPVKVASADPTAIVAPDALSPAAIVSGPAAAEKASPPADTVAVLDECFVIDACIDRYLWTLYQRTPKEDSIKVEERRAVTVKRRGKTVTVMRSFTKLVDEDFSWKDPKAAEHAGMSMMDYVIGGMDKSFKRKLFRTLLAAEAAGLSPGITSAFRDDYRQSIASGLKAASDRSYHGGSMRGGYGHGMAADIVSTAGNNRAQRWVSTEVLWKWVDANGKALGIGRPYLGRDPPHVGPIDGQEYVSKRGVATDRKEAANTKPKKVRAVASAKPPKAQAAREQKLRAKPQRAAQSAAKRTT
ncbi:hypothetical protein JJB99_20985 [Bradyrhizobium diazoefficiens]|uniref:hypothetical protein n=1 Tax=Bradyrhizobium diazoefficiens TaxID=1355477 RepID=UPI001909F4E7|nr:hypothetical protein [Bradyrhizobium diazoefficiens]QQO11976.1 hypothetical protein JJB99_20985 [Bradyrhizobium diazoefficiens]